MRLWRLRRDLKEVQQTEWVDLDADGFIEALGVNPEDFRDSRGGYDAMAALDSRIDNSDWNEAGR